MVSVFNCSLLSIKTVFHNIVFLNETFIVCWILLFIFREIQIIAYLHSAGKNFWNFGRVLGTIKFGGLCCKGTKTRRRAKNVFRIVFLFVPY
jgi:hypothetical protein